MNNLTANSRTKTGKGHNRRLRAAGGVPAVIYGGSGEVTSLSVKSAELMRLLRGFWEAAARECGVFGATLVPQARAMLG